MNIYFGRAQQDEFDFSDLFRVKTDGGTEYFYQAVEFGTNPGGLDEVRIYDTCNRSIPICVESIPELVEALNHCYNMHNNYTAAVNALSRAETNNTAVVEEMYTDCHEVVYTA